jgi:hypothetical protein
MDRFREVVTERMAESPRKQPSEVRPTPPPTPSRMGETPVHRGESRPKTPPATTHTKEDRVVSRKAPEIDRPGPLQESHTQSDSAPHPSTVARALRPETTPEPADIQVPVSRHAVVENVQPRQEPVRSIEFADTPAAVPLAAQQFPALIPERRQTVMREFAVTPLPGPFARPAVLQTEIAAPSIHVTIGKVTVQASLPAAPVHAPARAPAHNGPRLTLERYLDRRGGRL